MIETLKQFKSATHTTGKSTKNILWGMAAEAAAAAVGSGGAAVTAVA